MPLVGRLLIAAATLFVLLPLTVSLALPIYFACKQREVITKKFPTDAGDGDVLAFCSKEESMAYRGIQFGDEDSGSNRITRLSVVTISQRCIWITHLDLSGCKGDLRPVTPLGSLVKLTTLDLSFTNVEGDVKGLSTLVELTTLDLPCTKVEGDVKGLSTLVKLTTLYLYNTKVEGDEGALRASIPGLS